jgi:hypothetical protein
MQKYYCNPLSKQNKELQMDILRSHIENFQKFSQMPAKQYS